MGDYSSLLSTKESASRNVDFPHVGKPRIEGAAEWITYPPTECSECAKCGETGHKFLSRQTHAPCPLSQNPFIAGQYTSLNHWRLIQYLIHKLHRIAQGLYASQIGFLHNSPDGNNFCSTIYNGKVLAVSGSTITLDGETIDPRNVGIGYYSHPNPAYPDPCPIHGGEGLYCVTQLNGCLQANDYVIFDAASNDSVIAGRVTPDIVSVDVDGMAGSPKTFQITLDHSVAGARTCKHTAAEQEEMQPYDFYEDMCKVRICRHQHLPEDWLPLVTPYWLPCIEKQVEIDSDDFPVNNIFSLKDNAEQNCRVAIPKASDGTFAQTIRVRKRNADQSLTDITTEVLPYATKKRFAVIQTNTPTWESKLYLGATLADGSGGDNLLADSIGVIIDYYCEASSGYYHVCQGRCKWDTEDLTGVWGETYAGRKWFCRWRKGDILNNVPIPDEHANYTPGRCYQPGSCPEFDENEPWSAFMQGAQYFDEIHHAINIRRTQITAGNRSHRNLEIHRVKHPSLHLLAGIFRPDTPTTYFTISEIIGNGAYGRYVAGASEITWANGAIWEMPWAQEPDFGNSGTYPSKGLFPYDVTNWYKRRHLLKHDFLDNTSDPFYMQRSYQSRQACGTWRDADRSPVLGRFGLTGEGQGFVQRCGEAAQNLALVKANLQTRANMIVPWGTLAFGTYVLDGVTYGCAITVQSMNNWKDQEREKPINFGATAEVYSAVMDGALVKIECVLGTHVAGYLGVLERADDCFAWQGGGNIVELPDYLRIHNYYHPEAITGSLQSRKAQAGDTIEFSNLPGRRFYIDKVAPCAGGESDWLAGTYFERFDIPGYFILNTNNGDDSDKRVTNVTAHNDTDNEAMTEIVSLTRPDLAEWEFWVDYTTNTFLISPAEVGDPGDTITITYNIDEDGGAEYDEIIPDHTVGGKEGNAYKAGIPAYYADYEMERTANADSLTVWRWTGTAWEAMESTEGAPSKGQYKYFEVTGDAFIRFHYDNSDDKCKIQYTHGEIGGEPSGFTSIYLPLNYTTWGNKRDVLWVIDENSYLEDAIDASELEGGVSFDVTTEGKLSPHHISTVWWAPVGGDFTQIPVEDLRFDMLSEGLVYIKQSRLDTIKNA